MAFSLQPDLSFAPPSLRGLALEDTSEEAASNTTASAVNNVTEGLINTPSPYHDVVYTQPPTAIADATQQSQPQPHSQAEPFIDERLGLIIFLVSTITSIVLVLTMIVREYYFKRYGVDVCPLFASNSSQERDALDRRRRADSEQHVRDWAMANQLQMQLNEEGRDVERAIKRKERRKWYEYFLEPHCMTVQSSDIFFAHETLDGDDGNENNMSLPFKLRSMSTAEFSDDEEDGKKEQIRLASASFEEEEEVSDIVKETLVTRAMQEELSSSEVSPIECGREDDDAHRFLKLPVKNDDGIFRHVEGQCALCIDDYEVGDRVVWSDLKCSHAFHKECIMQWLSKGKKRCPVCRNWFVPGARIEEQKKLHGEEWELANVELTRLEDEQMVQEAHERGCHERCTSQDASPCNAAEVSESVLPEIISETSHDVNPPSVTSDFHSQSTLENLENVQQQPPTRATRLVSIATIEECTSPDTITNDCCDMDIPMNISTETEEANESIGPNEEV